jgi:hypothetical protein
MLAHAPRFAEFLQRKSVSLGGVLPAVHTTDAYHLRAVKEENKLIATECDVFRSEKLSYFFVGRPAYRYHADGSEPELWHMPCCLIFEFSAITNIKRVFPFDSGAFAYKRYPSYINKMKLQDFEASSAPDAVSRIIGAFFGSTRSYFELKAKDQGVFETEFQVGRLDFEVRALHRLAREKSPPKYDDRRFTIELQSSNDLDLSVTRPLAVVAPATLFDCKEFFDVVRKKWKADPLNYNDTGGRPVSDMYGLIYERVYNYLFGTDKLL